MKRWHHGHSIAIGVLGGLAIASYRVWLLLAAAFLLGIVVDRLIVNGSRLVRWIDRSVSPLTMRKWRMLRRRVNDLRPDDQVPF